MPLKVAFQQHTLDFRFDAGTSRGVLRQKNTWIIKIWDEQFPEVFGLGEASPLVKLSIDDVPDFDEQLSNICKKITGKTTPKLTQGIYTLLNAIVPSHLPSVYFGLEVALLDLLSGGKRKIFENDFSSGNIGIPINGLIWMGYLEDMLLQVTEKLESSFHCIKLKIGSIDFERECDILEYIRKKYYNKNITLRVDANGAFSPDEAMEKLKTLSKYDIHSIEQPIKAGQQDEMKYLCQHSPVPIALDEELIGIHSKSKKAKLLQTINPQYIILKPTLLGGLNASQEWIDQAKEQGIGWWMTSALESNIGLNAISQFVAQHQCTTPQGLGTGMLYHNNFTSPLTVDNGRIYYRAPFSWDLSHLSQLVD